MLVIDNHLDCFYFDRCDLGDPRVDGTKMVVPAQNLGITEGHPVYISQPSGAPLYLSECLLVFVRVRRSCRRIGLYATAEGKGFAGEETITDGPFEPSAGAQRLYVIGGVTRSPFGWAEWEIEAANFRLEIPDGSRLITLDNQLVESF